MTSALEVVGAEVSYRSRGRGHIKAVDGVDLAVERGEIVGLVGESGCGKSSLARAVVGLEPLSAGEIRLDGVPVAPVGWRTRTDVRVQMVFQSPYTSLNPRRTVGSQIADGVPDGVPRDLEVAHLLERVGLPSSAAARFPHQFSGGQRQRIAIARALAPRPEILVADEPVTALDASAQAQIVTLLTSLVRDLEVGMLFISHDLALVRHIADRTAVMYLGRIVEEGPTRQLWARPSHPYTRALIDAVPRISMTPELPGGLAGDVPDAANLPVGCRFAPRCPHRMPVCDTDPPAIAVGAGSAACWLLEDPTTHDTERVNA